MVLNAKDDKQRAALEEQIKKRWDKIKGAKAPPLDELRKFVSMFGSLFGVGKEARLTLAERLMDATDDNALLEAEQQLSLLRNESEDPEILARALEALARLNQGKKLLEDAAFYYRQLAERFPKIKVNGKTGAEYLDDLATDKRYLPYIDQTGRFTIKGKVELRRDVDKKGAAPTSQVYQFDHVGEGLPFFDNHKIGLTLDGNHHLKITDVTTNETQTLPLTRTLFSQIISQITQQHPSAPSRVKFNYQSMGHLVVLQVGNMIFGIDPLNKPRVLWEKNISTLPGNAAAQPSMTFDAKENTLSILYSDGLVQRLGTAGPLQGGVVTVAFKDSLLAIDPVTGRTLWTRTDINSRSHIFGDKENVYVVNLSDDNKPSGTRVLRAYDGVTVKAKDFTALYNARVGIQGRSIFTSQNDEKTGLTLRLYDILTGEDAWKQVFPVGTVQMTSEDPNLTGVIEPTGAVRVFDVEKRKEVMTTKLDDVAHLDKPQAVHLVGDKDFFYVAMRGQPDPNIPNNWNGMPPGVQPNVISTSGLRSIPVHGYVYAFKRKTGEIQWFNKVENQQMIVSMLDELPVILFTARYLYQPPPGNYQTMKYTMRAYAKHNGKLWYENDNLPANMYFHTLTMDHRAGKVEFIGYQLRVVLDTVPK